MCLFKLSHCLFNKPLLLLLTLGFLGANNTFAQKLKAGPMLGKLTHESVWLWAWGEKGDKLEAMIGERSFHAEADEEGFFRLKLSPLEPDEQFTYCLRLNGEDIKGAWHFRTFPDSTVFDFDMALGSCAYIVDTATNEIEGPGKIPFGKHYQIFDTIASRKPDVMFWLGDNIYLRDGEWNSRQGVLYRYAHSRKNPFYAQLLATGSHLAIWDDHDYGPNDSDRQYKGKAMTRDVFLKQWLNPEPVTDSGIFTTWRMGDVELFLLDDRSFRPRYRDGSMFGVEQQAWLIQKLKASNASFKIVATGSQLLSTQKLGEAYWEKSQENLRAFLDTLSAHQIPGLFFVSGDVHVTEISRYDLDDGYPLYDFTFSPMTSLPNPVPVNNLRRVKKSYFKRRNFGWMSFRGREETRRMIVKAVDRKGKTLWEHVIYASDLSN